MLSGSKKSGKQRKTYIIDSTALLEVYRAGAMRHGGRPATRVCAKSDNTCFGRRELVGDVYLCKKHKKEAK